MQCVNVNSAASSVPNADLLWAWLGSWIPLHWPIMRSGGLAPVALPRHTSLFLLSYFPFCAWNMLEGLKLRGVFCQLRRKRLQPWLCSRALPCMEVLWELQIYREFCRITLEPDIPLAVTRPEVPHLAHPDYGQKYHTAPAVVIWLPEHYQNTYWPLLYFYFVVQIIGYYMVWCSF